MSAELYPSRAKRALHAIILKNRVSGYFTYDLAMPGNEVWHGYNSGDITGATWEVIWSCPLPFPEEVYHGSTPADGRDHQADGEESS